MAQPPSPYQPPGLGERTSPPPDPQLIPTAQRLEPPTLQGTYDREEFHIPLEMPSKERVFRVESEASLRERIRQEFQRRNERAQFPEEPTLGDGREYAGRDWPLRVTKTVPGFLCYQPLYFEEKNAERYGWDAGIYQPFISTGKFYLDLVMLPYNMGVMCPWAHECNTGYPLPGDPVPYLIYLPPCDWKGIVLEAGTIAGIIALYGG